MAITRYPIKIEVHQQEKWCLGLRTTIIGDGVSIEIEADYPCVHSLWTATDGTTVFTSPFKYELDCLKAKRKALSNPIRAKASHKLTYILGDKKARITDRRQSSFPYEIHHVDFETATEMLERAMYWAAQDYVDHAGVKEVAVLLSGGADSSCAIQALTANGVKIWAYTVADSEDAFDAKGARMIAKLFDVHHHEVIILPESDVMFKAAVKAAKYTASTDNCNLKMAAMTTLAMERMPDHVKHVFHGHLSDAYFYNRGTLIGGFNKKYPECISARVWCEDRWRTQSLASTAQSVQIDAITKAHGKEWRCLFAHPKVEAVLFGVGLEAMPIYKGKGILWNYLERHIPNPTWGTQGPKVQAAYGVGSGLSRVKDRYPFLAKENCGKLYPAILKKLKGDS